MKKSRIDLGSIAAVAIFAFIGLTGCFMHQHELKAAAVSTERRYPHPECPAGHDPEKWDRFLYLSRDCGDLGTQDAYIEVFGIEMFEKYIANQPYN